MNLKRLLSRGAVSVGVIALGLGAFSPAAHADVAGSISNVTCGSGACPGPGNALGYTGTLKVTGSGFTQDSTLHTVFALECEHGATDSSQCDANTGDGSLNSNTSGNYTNNAYTYYALPNDALGVSNIVCDATHLCDLVLIQDDYNNFSNPHVDIPLTFDSGVDTPETPWLPLLPLGGVVIAGAGYFLWRRRRQPTDALAA